jgi:hypothetical protein
MPACGLLLLGGCWPVRCQQCFPLRLIELTQGTRSKCPGDTAAVYTHEGPQMIMALATLAIMQQPLLKRTVACAVLRPPFCMHAGP